MAERIVVVGGSRSGKSAVAEQLVEPAGQVTYVATAAVADDEMAARVAAHRARRPAAWHTVETTDLAAAIREAPAGAVLIDALATWLVERIGAHGLWPAEDADTAPLDEAAGGRVDALLAELEHAWASAAAHEGGPVVIVAEEVGSGVVPADPGARRFVDLVGWAIQRLSAAADRVLWVAAGRALDLPPGVETRVSDNRHISQKFDTRVAEAPPAGLREHGDTVAPPGALDLAVNVMPGGPPLHIAGQLRAAAADVGSYPDDTAAREAVAARHRLDPGAVLPTAGATDALWTLAAALAPARAAVIHPQFTEGEVALRAHGWAVTHVYRDPERGWVLEPDAVPDDAELVLVGNPVNPLGRLDDPAAIAALCRPGRLVVVDEAFVDFVADEASASLAGRAADHGTAGRDGGLAGRDGGLAGRDGGLAVVRTPTKLWGMPGVRAGVLLAAPELVDHVRAHRRPWAVGEVALAALRACSDDDEYRRRVAGETAAERERLRRRLTGLADVELAAEPAANFACLRVPDGETVHQRLLAQAVAVRRSTFPGLSTDHLRVAVQDAAATDRLVTALANALGQPSPAEADPHATERQERR